MSRHIPTTIRSLVFGIGVCCACQAGVVEAGGKHGDEPGWLPIVFARGHLAEQIEATPIENRPYRPLHFYGNTIRRMHYRGTPFPSMGEVLALPVRVVRRTRVDSLESAALVTREARVTVRNREIAEGNSGLRR